MAGERQVDVDKPGDFIGKKALQEIASTGPVRKLAGVSLNGPPIGGFIEPWPLFAGPERIGQVTRLAYSPRLERNIGLAIVPVANATPGTEVQLHTPAGACARVVSTLPFVPRKAKGVGTPAA